MGMHPVPRPPLGHNPRRPEEQDLDAAAEHDHRARETARAHAARPSRLRRLLSVIRRRIGS
jgi:hypothetical protein